MRDDGLGLDHLVVLTRGPWITEALAVLAEATRATLVTVNDGDDGRLATIHFSPVVDPSAGPGAQGSS